MVVILIFVVDISELTLWLAFLNRKLNSTACSVAKILPSKLFLAISFVVCLRCIDNCCFKKCSVYCSWQQNRHSVRRFGGRTSCCARLDSHHWVNFNSVVFFIVNLTALFFFSSMRCYCSKGTVPLSGIRPIEVFMCSIVLRTGFREAFVWVSQYLKWFFFRPSQSHHIIEEKKRKQTTLKK